jgi:hypothetical protein
MIVEPTQQRAKEPSRHAAVALTPLSARKTFLDLVDERDAWRHRVDRLESTANVLLGLADERTHERAEIERQSRPAGLVAEAFRKSPIAGARDPQQ